MSKARDNSGSQDRQKRVQNQIVVSQLEGKLNIDLLRMKKENVQQQALIQNLREELNEKERKYIQMTKNNKLLEDKLKSGSDQIKNLDGLVQSKVDQALAIERQELEKLRLQKSRLEEQVRLLENQLKSSESQNQLLQSKNIELENTLMQYTKLPTGNSTEQQINLKLREDCIKKEKRIDQMLKDQNILNEQMAGFLQENAYLRQLANVPANFGLNPVGIKLGDQKTADDFKKLIKVLQDDNFKLEEERAKLKHALRVMSIQDQLKNDPMNAERDKKFLDRLVERLKRMSFHELEKIDDFIVLLLNGNEGNEGLRNDRLIAENNRLKDLIGTTSDISKQLKDALKDVQLKGGDNSGLLQQLIDQNEALRHQIERLLQKFQTQGQGATTDGTNNPPIPIHPTVPGSSYYYGISNKFGGSQMSVHDENGHHGQKFLEVAFYQLQLQEQIEINKRKDDSIKDQSLAIDELQRKIKKQLLTQDALYKDYYKIKRSIERKEEIYSKNIRAKDDEIAKLSIQNKTMNKTIEAMTGPDGGGDLIRQRYIQLTQDHCLLEEKLMIVSRKFNILEEQESMLRRQYHDKDIQDGEKDIFLQQRITNLKKWKEMAVHQLSTLFNKLKNATPTADYDILRDQFELAHSKLEEQAKINAKHVSELTKVRALERTELELKEKQQHFDEKQFEMMSYIDMLTSRLERLDPVFRQENQIFTEIAARINESRGGLQQAFKIFDLNQDNELDKNEFSNALQTLRIGGLSTELFKSLWDSLDIDGSGTISVSEFVKKLEYYGVKNVSQGDQILSVLIDAANRAGTKDMNQLFDLFDQQATGYIERHDFIEIFKNLGVNVKLDDLNKFCDRWWSDKNQGIDYQQFLRMFKRFQLNQKEARRPKRKIVVSEKAIKLKKTAFDQINQVLLENRWKPKDLFKKVDSDMSLEIDKNEFFKMIQGMGFSNAIDERTSQEIFDSLDIDGNGKVSIAEFTAEFQLVCQTPLDKLLKEYKIEQDASRQANQYNPGELAMHNLDTQLQIMTSKYKQQELKMKNYERLMYHAEEQQKIAQQQNLELEDNWNQKNKEIFEIKAKNIQLEKEMKGMIRREDSESLKATNEKLQTELVEVRAAMLSYKNMTQVFSDQAKNIKLMHERKKDEHENLLAAMREMQAEDPSKERLGQLYSIIMLSRWQEAATGKKYDQVIGENKNLRQQLLESDVKISQVETKNFDILRDNEAHIEKLRMQATNQIKVNQQYMVKSSYDYFNKLIDQLSDRNQELEEKIFKIYEDSEKERGALDQANARLEAYAEFKVEEIARLNQNEMYSRMMVLTNKYQEVLVKEKKSSRQVTEQQARIDYLQNLFKGKNQALQELEQKNAKLEAEIVQKTEDFYKRDNERVRVHFSGLRDKGMGGVAAPQGIKVNADWYNAGGDPKGNEDGSRAGVTIGGSGLGYGGGSSNIGGGDDRNEMLKKLQDQLAKMVYALQIKDAQIKQYENWQGIDKNLTADEVLKDVISNHQATTTFAHDKEQKEMSDAAHQAIKTLQEMLAFKSESLNAKDQQIAKLRDEMIDRRTQDAEKIVKLQSELHSKELQLKEALHKGAGFADDSKKRPQADKWDRKAEKHYEDALREKDRVIKDLEIKLQGKIGDKGAYQQSSSKHQAEADALRAEIKRLTTEISNTAADKRRFQQLEVRRDEQDKMIKNLTAGLDVLKEKLTQAEMRNPSGQKGGLNPIEDLADRKKLQLEKEQKEKFANSEKRAQELTKDKQYLVVEKTNLEKRLEEMKRVEENAKRKVDDLQREVKELKAESDKLRKQLAEANSKDNALKMMKDLEELKKENGELKQENKILQASQKQVVAFDREREVMCFIGESVLLGLPQQDLKIERILQAMATHVQQNKSVSSLRLICQSFDTNRRGELSQEEFTEACKLIGITLLKSEVQLIERACSTSGTSGVVCYDPIVRYLQGIPTYKFMEQNPLIKIAELVKKRDATKADLRSWLVDQNSNATEINYADLMKKLKLMFLNATDVTLSQEDLDKIWTLFNNGNPSTQAQPNVAIQRILDDVFKLLRAFVINNIYQHMQRHDLYFWKLLAKVNPGKEEYLTTTQMKNLLIDIGYSLMDNVFDDLMQVMEIRQGKWSYTALMKYFGNAFVTVKKMPDSLQAQKPSLVTFNTQNNLIQQQKNDKVQKIARKVLIGWPKIKVELANDEGIISRDELSQRIEKKVSSVDANELQELVRWADFYQRGQICISVFIQRIVDQAQEAPADTLLRELNRKANLQGVNLLESLKKFDRGAKTNALEKRQFKQAFNSVPLGYSDAEIEKLFEHCEKNGSVNIVDFAARVKEIGKTEPLPQELRKAETPGSFSTKTGGSNEPPHELEKKYTKCLSELKDQIESQNRDLNQAKKEIERKDYEKRKLEEENQALISRKCEMPNASSRSDKLVSDLQSAQDEAQRLTEEIHHFKEVNDTLRKKLNVDLKAELGKLTTEKEQAENKLKIAQERLKQKTEELNNLMGKPMDAVTRREEREEARQRAIDIMDQDICKLEAANQELQNKLFAAEEKLLDLKFEKETFDLQYARMQKRISELEKYKMKAAAMSDDVRKQYEDQLEEIKDQTDKLRGDAIASKPGENVKLRRKTNKTAQELEGVVESLKRVIEKQKVELDHLSQQKQGLEGQVQKKVNEPALLNKIKTLETQLQHYTMQDLAMEEKDQTIKKLTYANLILRNDLEREIERFALLEKKFRDSIIKYNIKERENSRNQQTLFETATGARIQNFEPLLDDRREFGHRREDGKDHGDDSDGSLNAYNRSPKSRSPLKKSPPRNRK